ncbi:hypothetical protein ACH5RR_041788, partial [Cinchona calisaya]
NCCNLGRTAGCQYNLDPPKSLLRDWTLLIRQKNISKASKYFRGLLCRKMNLSLSSDAWYTTSFSAENITGCSKSNLQHHQSLEESGSFIELHNSRQSNFNVQESSIMNSTCKSELLVDMVKTSQQFCESTVNNQNFGPLLHSSKDQLQIPNSLCT